VLRFFKGGKMARSPLMFALVAALASLFAVAGGYGADFCGFFW
jgi:hypothetical protein